MVEFCIDVESADTEKEPRIVNGADSDGYPWLAAIGSVCEF